MKFRHLSSSEWFLGNNHAQCGFNLYSGDDVKTFSFLPKEEKPTPPIPNVTYLSHAILLHVQLPVFESVIFTMLT